MELDWEVISAQALRLILLRNSLQHLLDNLRVENLSGMERAIRLWPFR
jgi:hypothetical protein